MAKLLERGFLLGELERGQNGMTATQRAFQWSGKVKKN
jgi:hypothetical protein